jgi:peptidoglycan/xylan/chitin deacetylase (PgdA/CDA1 family)
LKPGSACITIDLDALPHYAALYGLPATCLPEVGAEAVARLAPGRLCDILAELGSPARATFFAVGEDLASEAGAAPLRAAARAGHEIGNHTLHHLYGLTALDPRRMMDEVEGGAAAIQAAIGSRPLGFRAPGYTLSAALLESVVRSGHVYDSSVFPAAPYYFAKATVLAWQRVAGRRSVARLDRSRVLGAPRLPYRPSRSEPYARGDLPLWELPISTSPVLRFPFLGTLLSTLPERAFDAVYRSLRRQPFVNLELHGIDLMDASDGAGDLLPSHQRDLRIPAAKKMARLRRLLGRMAADFQLVTLHQAALGFGPLTPGKAAA